MNDPFASHAVGLSAPIVDAIDISPDDGADLTVTSRALYVGGAGDVRLTLAGGRTVTLRAVQVGWHPVRARRVWATGTTATDIVAGW